MSKEANDTDVAADINQTVDNIFEEKKNETTGDVVAEMAKAAGNVASAPDAIEALNASAADGAAGSLDGEEGTTILTAEMLGMLEENDRNGAMDVNGQQGQGNTPLTSNGFTPTSIPKPAGTVSPVAIPSQVGNPIPVNNQIPNFQPRPVGVVGQNQNQPMPAGVVGVNGQRPQGTPGQFAQNNDPNGNIPNGPMQFDQNEMNQNGIPQFGQNNPNGPAQFGQNGFNQNLNNQNGSFQGAPRQFPQFGNMQNPGGPIVQYPGVQNQQGAQGQYPQGQYPQGQFPQSSLMTPPTGGKPTQKLKKHKASKAPKDPLKESSGKGIKTTGIITLIIAILGCITVAVLLCINLFFSDYAKNYKDNGKELAKVASEASDDKGSDDKTSEDSGDSETPDSETPDDETGDDSDDSDDSDDEVDSEEESE